MGTVYSISRVGTFDDCRLRYRYQYVDRLKAEKETIEAYMGSRVHEALQELYGFVRNGVVKPLEWLLDAYEDLWDRNLTDAVKVVRPEFTADDYRRKGRKCLEDYYRTYAPFDRAKVVATEKKVTFKLRDEAGEVEFLGFIDRLDWNDRDRVFEIHDYKTSGSLPSQEDADADEQLGLYHLAVRSEWPDAEDVRLVWHYLVFDKEIVSSRKPEDLEALEKEIVRRVRRIEAATDFPPTRSALCDWCGFQDVCPEWKHPVAVAKLPVNEYLKDEGVTLVAKYAELAERKKALKEAAEALEAEERKLEEAAFAYARCPGYHGHRRARPPARPVREERGLRPAEEGGRGQVGGAARAPARREEIRRRLDDQQLHADRPDEGLAGGPARQGPPLSRHPRREERLPEEEIALGPGRGARGCGSAPILL